MFIVLCADHSRSHSHFIGSLSEALTYLATHPFTSPAYSYHFFHHHRSIASSRYRLTTSFVPRQAHTTHSLLIMALSAITDAYKPKIHRRATVDAVPPGSLGRPNPRRMHRRLSLPVSVKFSNLSEVCVFEQVTPAEVWYTGEDHQRFKRERISDVVSFREQSRRNGNNHKKSSSSSSSGGGSAPRPSNPASAGSCCPVGIEQLLSTKGLLEAHSNRKIVIQSVLSEQHRQRSFGFQDPNQIAILSVQLSAEAFEGAQKRGKFQEMAKFV